MEDSEPRPLQPQMLPPRPRYRVYDRVNHCWWRPTYEAESGRLEDLSLMPGGDLLMRTLNDPAIGESVFVGRFAVVAELDNYTPCLN